MSNTLNISGRIYTGLMIAVALVAYGVPFTALASIQKRIFLTSPTSTITAWTVPSDFNNYDNTIEAIGGGGGGSRAQVNTTSATGGGGGAYAQITNLNLSGLTTITVKIGAGGPAAATDNTNGTAGLDTFFNRTSGSANTCADTVSVCAKGGLGGNKGVGIPAQTVPGGFGGSATTSVGSTRYQGGSGGGSGNADYTGTGGGGAAVG